MINSFEIDRYRCFSHVSAKNLSRVNIIVGQSGTGKTALMEALFLCAGGSPQHYFHILSWRGVVGQQVTLESETYNQFFREMFHKFSVHEGASLKIEDSMRGVWSLEIAPANGAQRSLVSPGGLDSGAYVPISFKSKSGSGQEHEAKIEFGAQGQLQFPPPPDPYPIIFLNNVTLASPAQGAGRFSQLVQDGNERAVIDPLSKLYGNINDVRMANYAGTNVLLAAVDGLGRLPISSVSGGINKYLTILITIAHKQRNVVLVDEIENGFYYENMAGAWNGLLAACRSTDSQLFVTTHSRECLTSLLPVLEANPDDFTLIRTERQDDEILPVQFSGQAMYSSLKQHFEIR